MLFHRSIAIAVVLAAGMSAGALAQTHAGSHPAAGVAQDFLYPHSRGPSAHGLDPWGKPGPTALQTRGWTVGPGFRGECG